nr:hypothetical protein [Rhodococcus sp. 15-649-1-2]
MTPETIRPRPGSHIWRRTDDKPTQISRKKPGSQWLTRFPGVTDEELAAAEVQDPAGEFVSDGKTKCEVERILNFTDVWKKHHAAVVLGPTKPSFGEWEELAEWTLTGE